MLLTARPYRGLAISAGLAVAEMWAGLTLAYAAPAMPPSFAIIAVATACYAAAFARPGSAGPNGTRRRQQSGAAAPRVTGCA